MILRLLPLLLLFPLAVSAQGSSRLLDRLTEGNAPLKPAIEETLSEHKVGNLSLREHLATLSFVSCLTEMQDELVAGLDRLRRIHVTAREYRSAKSLWRAWDEKLDGLSNEAIDLVTTWLDSPDTARRKYLCEDDLPVSWRELDPDRFSVAAVEWFEFAYYEEEAALHQGTQGDREQAVMRLMELREGLLARFDATFPGEGAAQESRQAVAARLDLMWERLVSPYHYGFTPSRTADPGANPDSMGKARVANPFQSGGMGIPDPRDAIAKNRVVRSWSRQRAVLDDELKERQDLLDEALDLIASAESKSELDHWVRQASLLRADLEHTISDIERMQNRVRHYSTGRSWVDDMLSNGSRRKEVRLLTKRARKTQDQLIAVEEAIVLAVEKGADAPLEAGVAAAAAGRARAGDGVASGDEPGPGNWTAGLSGAGQGPATDLPSPDDLAGQGWVERAYEGPLPPPSATWSPDLVAAIRARHGSLDDRDVRILLGLVKAAYRELPSRADVEAAVWRALGSSEGLRIRGEEATLSDLYVPGAGSSEQPIITFVLTLYF